MRRALLLAATAVAASLALAPAASAHKGSPEYLSIVRDVAPAVPGLSVVMLDRSDRLQVTNRGSKTVVFMGYSDEPYLRFLPSGVVQRNTLSPATYLNADPSGEAPVPKTADADAPPQWETVSQDGRYEFHDHRIHWMGQGRPPIVKDPDKKTKVQDWRVPIKIGDGASPGAVTGTLYWTPIDGGGPPVAAIVALVVLLVGAVVLVVVVRRRRGPATDEDDDDSVTSPPREAW